LRSNSHSNLIKGGPKSRPPFRFCSGNFKNERRLSNINPLTTSSTGVYDVTGVGAKTSEGVHFTVLASSRMALQIEKRTPFVMKVVGL
jgi:hypothetical protein